jgi:hypothetical protein
LVDSLFSIGLNVLFLVAWFNLSFITLLSGGGELGTVPEFISIVLLPIDIVPDGVLGLIIGEEVGVFIRPIISLMI